MTLSAMVKVRLGRELNSLVQASQDAKGLQKIGIGRKINAILLQLGFGSGGTPAEELPEKPPEAVSEELSDLSQVGQPARPEVVEAFLKGEYTNLSSEAFTETLILLEPFVDIFLSMDDVVIGSSDWLRANYPEAA